MGILGNPSTTQQFLCMFQGEPMIISQPTIASDDTNTPIYLAELGDTIEHHVPVALPAAYLTGYMFHLRSLVPGRFALANLVPAQFRPGEHSSYVPFPVPRPIHLFIHRGHPSMLLRAQAVLLRAQAVKVIGDLQRTASLYRPYSPTQRGIATGVHNRNSRNHLAFRTASQPETRRSQITAP